MHTGSLKKLALALTFWLALHVSSLKAQIFTNDLPLQAVTTGSNPVDFEFRADGTLIAKGNLGVGSLLSSDQGAGTRMLWFPSLGAFRAGGVTSDNPTQWDISNIGQYSVAFGANTRACGIYSAAIGFQTTAQGDYSFAGGIYGQSSGTNAFSWGGNVSAGGNDSVAFGSLTTASGDFSFASGFVAIASGKASSASGYGVTASGAYSSASGYNTTASGNYSTASGYHTSAAAVNSFVIGTCNIGGGNPSSGIPSDPVFEIGNGTPTALSDALIVHKDGSAIFQGPVTAAPSGDIPMYTGN